MRIDWTSLTRRSHKVGLSKSTLTVTAMMVVGSAALVAMPTPAAAFDINGLVQGVVAQYVAGGRLPNLGGFGGTHYTGARVVTHRSRHDDDEDAAPGSINTPPPRQITDTPSHFSTAGSRMVSGPTDNDRTVTTARSDEPAFAPSR